MEGFSLPDLSAVPTLTGLLVMLFAAAVALTVSQRTVQRDATERLPWWLAGTVALATGLWASGVLGVAHLAMAAGAEFDVTWSVVAGLATFVFAALGLHASLARQPSMGQRLAGVGLLGAATLAPTLSSLAAVGLQRSDLAQLSGLSLLGWMVASSSFGWGMAVAQRPNCSRRAQAAAAALIGAGVLAAQSLVLGAVPWPAPFDLADGDGIGSHTLATLASVGAGELLLLLALALAVEARLRGRLDRAQTELMAHALRDELTGLANRSAFDQRMSALQREVDAGRGKAAVLLVALDGFRQVNESYGHACGDALLLEVAQRLRTLVEADALARLGGDEFLLVLHGDAALQEATVLAAQVVATLSQPCHIDGRELATSGSVGVAGYPVHGPASELLTHAAVAMRTAKNAGGNTYAIFDPRMVIDQRDQAELLHDLRLALVRSQLELYYQPKVHAPSAQITGVEALLRWHHPQRGMISPVIFIPLAERSGLINKIGAWVIDEACRQARAWRDQGLRMRVAINLSAHQLRQRDLPQYIADALQRHQINPDLLTCEITESVAMEDTETTARFFAELAAVGVHISIDDFGSGYSSLSYLRKLPAGELKIDRSFVMDVAHSEEARKIAAAVVQLAQALKLKVVAEGVETEAQFNILRQLGCDELQGFLFAKPMSARALGLWAAGDDGTRAVQFSESLFQESRSLAL
ncbi:MAG: EAL domain-containing protein [Burkholderiales bacterium]|nr:EAL domain-containing protein [Burkholderiales bacterium]